MKPEDVEISHPDKVLFPEAGITKRDFADYFERIAEYILPHIKSRPLTLKRYPEGVEKEGFYNKHAPEHFPSYITRLNVPMRSKGGDNMKMVSADKAADLVYFAGQDVIELHMGLSKAGDLEKPDQIIFDFDPSDDDFEKVREAALALKALLDKENLTSFVKTTGSRGVHVHIPLRPEEKFQDVKPVAREIAQKLHEEKPDLTTLEQRKGERGDKVFIDILRNDYGMTGIAPYSPRAKKSAAIATPVDWEELKGPALGPQSYTVKNIFRRLSQKEDPWKNFARHGTSLKSVRL